MDDQNQPSKVNAWATIGKGVLSALKETATDKIDETKKDLFEAGDDLLDRLVMQLKFIGFLIVSGLLILFAVTTGISEQFQLPQWAVALALGIATYVGGVLWKAKNILPKSKR
ncbi:MAG: hypothetical protein EOP04_18215 [Proteobacteria bacterium]|nr:MAG: hypothetical protein EOP04_18215 [Pseudomonadota bacterium]